MRHHTLAVILMTFSTPLFARGGPKTPRTPSSEERKGVGYTLDVQPMTPFSSGDGSGVTSGGSFGAFLGPNLVARATYRGGRSCVEGSYQCAIGEHTTALTLQQFVSNSFFFEVGGMIRRNTYRPGLNQGLGDDADGSVVVQTDTRGITGAIGNQWQWKSFTLGARWVGFYHPMQVTQSRVDSDDAAQVSPRDREVQGHMERQGSSYGPSFLIGFSF